MKLGTITVTVNTKSDTVNQNSYRYSNKWEPTKILRWSLTSVVVTAHTITPILMARHTIMMTRAVPLILRREEIRNPISGYRVCARVSSYSSFVVLTDSGNGNTFPGAETYSFFQYAVCAIRLSCKYYLVSSSASRDNCKSNMDANMNSELSLSPAISQTRSATPRSVKLARLARIWSRARKLQSAKLAASTDWWK